MRKFTYIDTESAWDEHLHEGARQIDSSIQPHHRIGSKRIFAASAFDVTVSIDGAISCEHIATWSEHTHGGEQEIVACLFHHLRARTDRTVIGYGSMATDVPILQLAAMQFSLPLPAHFLSQRKRFEMPDAPGRHFDLALGMKGAGRTWHHLTEIILRVGLPVALMETKKHVDFPSTREGWEIAAAHVELDCVLLAIAHLAWLRIQGQANVDSKIAALVVLEWFSRNGKLTESVRAKLENACGGLSATITNERAMAA